MNAIKHWMLPVLMLLCAAGLNTACDELLNDEKEEGRSVETEPASSPSRARTTSSRTATSCTSASTCSSAPKS